MTRVPSDSFSGRKVCLNINFDSLFSPLSIDHRKFLDPSYFQIADRFMEEADRGDFRYTIFVIGRDLENSSVFSRVREWAQAGHEISNHSWSHHPNLGALPRSRIEEEVLRSHEIITRCTLREPRGFASPGWSTSSELVEILSRTGYLYDTSIFPSPVIVLALLKLQLNARRHGDFDASWFRRRDKKAAFLAPQQPYFIRPDSLVAAHPDGLLELPLPTTVLRLPCWHTLSFYSLIGERGIRRLIRRAARASSVFYYLMHPADLADPGRDLDAALVHRHANELATFERLGVPLGRKLRLFREAMEEVRRVGAIVTLEEIAHETVRSLKEKWESTLRTGAGIADADD